MIIWVLKLLQWGIYTSVSTWKTPVTVANKGKDSTTSKGCAVRRISLRYWGELSARGSEVNRWLAMVAPLRVGRSGRVMSLCRTFLVMAWVYVMERKPCCWWEPSRTFAAVWPMKKYDKNQTGERVKTFFSIWVSINVFILIKCNKNHIVVKFWCWIA